MAMKYLLLLAFALCLTHAQLKSQHCNVNIDPRVNCPAGHYNAQSRPIKSVPENVPQGSRNDKQWHYGMNFLQWGSLCKHYNMCTEGWHQSPINIPSKSDTTGNLHVMYDTTDVNMVRVDQVVTMPITGTHTLNWMNRSWEMKHIEFHYPSEHMIDGEHKDFEVQLYHEHKDPMGKSWYTAISVLYDVDQCNNAFLDHVFPKVPHVHECECGNGRTEDYQNLGFPQPFNEQCDRTTNNNTGADGVCRANCERPRCGDGILDTTCGEFCDTPPLGFAPGQCRPNCTLPHCGDGVTDPGEECDDFPPRRVQAQGAPVGGSNSTRCDAQCRFRCGNGRIDPFLNEGGYQEECDDGPLNTDAPSNRVPPVCRKGSPNPLTSGFWPVGASVIGGCVRQQCGDGITDPGEECDDGPISSPNAPARPNDGTCQPGCIRPTCGNGFVDVRFNEQCEPGQSTPEICGAVGTPFACMFLCGNGVVDTAAGEECDGGTLGHPSNPANPQNNNSIPDRCRENCRNPICGDGVTDANEQCDDIAISSINTTVRGSCLCYADCTRRCGNSFMNIAETVGLFNCPAEECDNGAGRPNDGNNNQRPNSCRNDCTMFKCGDGVTDELHYTDADPRIGTRGGEMCDTGAQRSDVLPGACRLNCKPACCGDGVTDPGEICDHGPANKVNGTTGNNKWDNAGCSSDCRPLCGNGVRGDGEDCDDGSENSNTTKNACRVDVCLEHHCGDGVTDDDEECDYRSLNHDNETCNTACRLTFCGDGFVQKSLGEECDTGAANGWGVLDGCSPICTVNRCGQSRPNPRVQVNLKDLVPQITGPAYSYMGSWTKPPCSENVHWLVLQNRQRIGIDQLWQFEKWVGKNSRPVQHIGSRMITEPSRWGPPVHMSMCGNGKVEAGEECDDGRSNSDLIPNACRKNCKAPSCGDGVVDQGEDCENTNVDWCKNCKHVHLWWRYQDWRKNHEHTHLKGHPQLPVGAAYTAHNNTCPWWNYDNEPIWEHLGPGCDHCAGMRQSPIDIPTKCANKTRLISLNHPANMHYQDTPVVLFNTGQLILWPIMHSGFFSFHGKTYQLKHIEFHEPSEHMIGGKRYDFEIQLHHDVSTNPNVKQRAIIAVVFEKGCDANPWLDKFWALLPTQHECRCGNGIKEDIYCWPDGTVTKEECDNGAMNMDNVPDMCRTNCRLPRCGDGVVDMGEACDWGSANSNTEPNHCRLDCTVPKCGDGVIDDLFGEKCDDSNCAPGDGCDGHCHPECGNGLLDAGEQCDNGMRNSDTAANACRTTCVNSTCGDGIVDEGEECDMGSLNSDTEPNRCRTTCIWPKCGDGVTDPVNLELCDEHLAGGNGCTAPDFHHGGCRLLCGNGHVDPGEECDNGAANSDKIPNACRTNCKNATCGDGVRDSFEECDGPAPWCSDRCTVCCGNGKLDCNCAGPDEECDHGILNSDTRPAACRMDCKMPRCGDGVLDAYLPWTDCFEECDAGAGNSDTAPNTCRSNCKKPYCGDGVVDAGEECDDGNHICGDGCSEGCKNECGNGIIDPGEECDDGADNSDDKPGCCRKNCKLPTCGDGVTDCNEECDDGDMNKDGPNTCRTTCLRPACGDGIVDYLYGEKCDKAFLNSETTIDGCSPRCTPNQCAQSVNMDIQVNPHEIIPKTPGTYCYDGSTNHPPCSEDAQWFVFSAPQTISECQLKHYKRILSNNRRPTQPLNGRTVSLLEDKAVCGDGIVEGNEECDDGPRNSNWEPNACRRNCMKAHCGDGVHDMGEQCDGTPNCDGSCKLSCTSAASCPNCNATSAGDAANQINVNFGN